MHTSPLILAQTQKWQTELAASPLWLLQTLAGVLFAAALAALLLSRTRFGREFWQVLKPCLSRRGALAAAAVVVLMIVLLLTEVRLYVLNTFLYSSAYSAMQDRLAAVFWTAVSMNAAVMLIRSVNLIINDFLDQALAIKWAEQLNRVLTRRWLAGKTYHRLQMRRDAPDNIDQRIQMDAQEFIVSTITFLRGMLNSVISTIEFTIVLWGLAGMLPVFGIEIPHGIVFLVYLAILAATALAMWIGRPLIRSNYENEHLNGDYRYSLVRIRDHSESIAFYNGEWRERQQLSERFRAIIANRWRIARQSVTLSGFNDVFSQIMQLLPLMLQAPRLFAGQIKIGDVQQTVQSFARLQKSMSFFRNFYKDFTVYRARLERIAGFMDSMDDKRPAHQPDTETLSDGLILDRLTLLRHNGDTLLANVSFTARPGDPRRQRLRQNLPLARPRRTLALRQQRPHRPPAAGKHHVRAAKSLYAAGQPPAIRLLPRAAGRPRRRCRRPRNLPPRPPRPPARQGRQLAAAAFPRRTAAHRLRPRPPRPPRRRPPRRSHFRAGRAHRSPPLHHPAPQPAREHHRQHRPPQHPRSLPQPVALRRRRLSRRTGT